MRLVRRCESETDGCENFVSQMRRQRGGRWREGTGGEMSGLRTPLQAGGSVQAGADCWKIYSPGVNLLVKRPPGVERH